MNFGRKSLKSVFKYVGFIFLICVSLVIQDSGNDWLLLCGRPGILWWDRSAGSWHGSVRRREHRAGHAGEGLLSTTLTYKSIKSYWPFSHFVIVQPKTSKYFIGFPYDSKIKYGELSMVLNMVLTQIWSVWCEFEGNTVYSKTAKENHVYFHIIQLLLLCDGKDVEKLTAGLGYNPNIDYSLTQTQNCSVSHLKMARLWHNCKPTNAWQSIQLNWTGQPRRPDWSTLL